MEILEAQKENKMNRCDKLTDQGFFYLMKGIKILGGLQEISMTLTG